MLLKPLQEMSLALLPVVESAAAIKITKESCSQFTFQTVITGRGLEVS